MPHIESNMPQNTSNSGIKDEFLRIARSSLRFISKELLECIKQQCSKRSTTGTSLRKIILPHPERYQHCSI